MPQTSSDSQNKKGLFGLFKGESGSGKSVGALSFPNAYIFDFDRKMPTIAEKHFSGVHYEWDTFKDIFEVSDKISEFQTQGCPYETLISDSLTNLVVTTLNSIGMTKGEEVMKQLKTRTKGGSIEIMSIDYYNGETNFIERYWLDALKGLWARDGNPKHVIITAHVITSESAPDLKTKIVTKSSSIVTAGKKVAAYVPTVFDDMYHFGVQLPDFGSGGTSVKRVCITDATGDESAKCSYRFPQVIDFTNRSLYKELCKYHDFEAGRGLPEPLMQPVEFK